MSKFIYKDTLQTKYNEGTILTDDVKCKTLEVNKITSDNPFINIDKDINLNSDLLINGDLSINGDINIEDIDIDTIKTNTITSDNSKIDFNKGINTTKYLSIGNNNYNITVDGGLCLGNFAAQPYNDGLLKIGTGTGNNDRQTGLLFDNNGALNVRNKIITNDLESKNGNNIIKIYDNSISISKDNGTNWRGLISAGTGTNAVILNNLSTNTASGDDSYTEGTQNTASGNQSHAEGYNNVASGNFTHAEGYYTTAAGNNSHAEGYNTQTLSGNYPSHSEGSNTKARGESAHAEGHVDQNDTGKRTINGVEYNLGANGKGSHAEGHNTIAQSIASHSEGSETAALHNFTHAEGSHTIASGNYGSHAEGANTTASGWGSHAEGEGTTASANYSHSGGLHTISNTVAGTAIGKYNISGTNKLFVVGNGTDDNNRSDAFVVYEDGNVSFNNSLFKSGSGHSQFLTHANQNTNDNANDTRAISNGDFNYIIIGDIINITIPLKSKDKFVSGFRSKHNLSTDFCDYYLINLDFNNIKTIFDTHYNASTSMFYAGSQCFSILTRPRVLKCYDCRTSTINYGGSYQNGLTIIIDSQGPSSGIYATDYAACYIENFDGFVDDQYLNITLKYVKLS